MQCAYRPAISGGIVAVGEEDALGGSAELLFLEENTQGHSEHARVLCVVGSTVAPTDTHPEGHSTVSVTGIAPHTAVPHAHTPHLDAGDVPLTATVLEYRD